MMQKVTFSVGVNDFPLLLHLGSFVSCDRRVNVQDRTVNPGFAEPELMRFGPCLQKPQPQVLCCQTKQKDVAYFYFLDEVNNSIKDCSVLMGFLDAFLNYDFFLEIMKKWKARYRNLCENRGNIPNCKDASIVLHFFSSFVQERKCAFRVPVVVACDQAHILPFLLNSFPCCSMKYVGVSLDIHPVNGHQAAVGWATWPAVGPTHRAASPRKASLHTWVSAVMEWAWV